MNTITMAVPLIPLLLAIWTSASAEALPAVPQAASAHRSPTDCPTTSFVVAIDIGHSAQQPGATSARGVTEFAFNSRLAREIEAALHAASLKEAFIVHDRADGPLTLTGRPEIAAKEGAHLFLSVHHDSVQPKYLSDWQVHGLTRYYSDLFSGYSLFVSNRNPRFEDSVGFGRRLGAALRRQGLQPTLHHAEPIKGENRPLLDADLGLYRYDGLAVLRSASMPALLLEAGIIVNRDEEQRLENPEYRAKITAAVVEAVTGACAALLAPNAPD